jgi:hypothetical protein
MSPSPFQPQLQQVFQQQPACQQQPSPYQQPQQPNAYLQPQQPNAYQQPHHPNADQQPHHPNAYQQQPQEAVNQAPAWAAPQQQASAEQMYSPPKILAPYPFSQSTSTAASNGNVSTASAEELFASPSPPAKQEKVPDLSAVEPVTSTVTEDNVRELFAPSAGESVPEQQTKADVSATSEVVAAAAAASEPTAPSAVEAFAAPVGATILPSSAGAAGGAADFFGSAPHGVESKPPAAAASNEDEPEKVQETQRGLSPTNDMDEVGLDDVPLEEVPLTTAVEGNTNVAATLNNPSAATYTGVFSSIGLPPPPFSSRQ